MIFFAKQQELLNNVPRGRIFKQYIYYNNLDSKGLMRIINIFNQTMHYTFR